MRCVSIDWLEVFVSEDPVRRYEPEDFERRGYMVDVRAYGTKTFEQMFTILDTQANPMIEVRRKPRGVDGIKKTVYSLGDCYLRLTNAYCYHPDPIGIVTEFMQRENYALRRIYRIDLAIDFAKFDEGDNPTKVARRIVNHTYAKINQADRRTQGKDTWTECHDNWISWGATGSMVGTKFYNKAKEIRDEHFTKPWIVQRWLYDGLIDNPITLSLAGAEQDIWRVEFSIKSSAKEWVIVQKGESMTGEKEVLPHSLDLYETRQGVLTAIANLVPHYFHFKIYEEGKLKYKCKDKILFKFTPEEIDAGYRLTNESDAGRKRPKAHPEDYTAIKTLSRIVATNRSERVKALCLEAIEELNNAIQSDYDISKFYRALILAHGNVEQASKIASDPDIFA